MLGREGSWRMASARKQVDLAGRTLVSRRSVHSGLVLSASNEVEWAMALQEAYTWKPSLDGKLPTWDELQSNHGVPIAGRITVHVPLGPSSVEPHPVKPSPTEHTLVERPRQR